MLRCAYFTFEGRCAGTSYHQAYIYRDFIQQHGVSFEYYPMLPNCLWVVWRWCAESEGVFAIAVRKLLRSVVIPVWRLLQICVAVIRANHMVIIGGCLLQPHSVPWLEVVCRRCSKAFGKPTILYLADAMHTVFPGQYAARYRLVDHIIAVTPWLVEDLRKQGLSCSLSRIAIDVDRYPSVNQMDGGKVVIGFSGGPNNFKDLVAIEGALERILEAFPSVSLVVVSGVPPVFSSERVKCRFVKWSNEDPYTSRYELGAKEMLEFKIALAPLLDTNYSRGKDSAKLRQYMALGLAIVGSDVGVNSEMIRPGVNGLLASTEEEWFACLQRLIQDPELRHRLGVAAMSDVRKSVDVRVQAKNLAEQIKACAERGSVAWSRNHLPRRQLPSGD